MEVQFDDVTGGERLLRKIGEEELDDLEEKLEIDYQIGEDIKEKVRLSTLCYMNASHLFPL